MTAFGKRMFSCQLYLGKIFSNNCVKRSGFQTSCRRYLFTADILGIESFKRKRNEVQEQIGDLKDKFCNRMEDYMNKSASNTIFTDDLQTILYVAETDEDIKIAEKMMKRYHAQSSELRFSNFVFGPVVMRLCHTLNLSEISYQLLTDEELQGFFNQISSYLTGMDIQFENGRYQEVLELFDLMTSKKTFAPYKYPVDCGMLCIAACLKLNTPESFANAQTILRGCAAADSKMSSRGLHYAALLALRQNVPEVALEILSGMNASHRVPIIYTNVKLLIYVALGRIEESVALMKAVVERDVADHTRRGNELFREVVDAVAEAVEKVDDVVLSRQCKVVLQALEIGNHITDSKFEEYIFCPIVRRRQLQDGYKSRMRPSLMGGQQRSTARVAYRPGLSDRHDIF